MSPALCYVSRTSCRESNGHRGHVGLKNPRKFQGCSVAKLLNLVSLSLTGIKVILKSAVMYVFLVIGSFTSLLNFNPLLVIVLFGVKGATGLVEHCRLLFVALERAL